MKKGYLTVYLSLTLALILSLILALVEGARINTIKMEAECVADIGMNSVLAEFHRELLEQYDLLFVDMSYGTNISRIENTAQHLRAYMQKNFTNEKNLLFSSRDWLAISVDKAAIRKYSIASDNGGSVMKRQAVKYMKGASAEGAIAQLLEQFGEMDKLGLNTRNIIGERNHIQAQIDAVELPMHEDENGQQTEITLDNPADQINASRSSFLLSLILGDTADISRTAVRTGDYISHREVIKGTGDSEEAGTDIDLLFDCYLFDKFGWFTNQLEKSHLKYQIEYIIAGKESDIDNLEEIAKKLLLWRETANVIYILSDSGKCAEAEALALTLTAVAQVPVLVKPVKYSILFAWAYIESLYDVKCLLRGNRVPLLKTHSDWKTGIESIVNFSESQDGNAGGSETGGKGLSYQDYLRLMLYLESDRIKNMRSMDIMEMDIRRTPGNSHFRMDACFDSFLSEVSVSSAFGYHFTIRKQYGYD